MQKQLKVFFFNPCKYSGVNFKRFEENYDYRKFLSYNYLIEFEDLYIQNSAINTYFFNRLFLAKCYIFESKKRLSTSEINNMAIGESKFIMFCLNKPIYKLNKVPINQYSKTFSDITNIKTFPRWMEPDTLYTFKMKLLKKEVKNIMIPYHQIIDFKSLYKVDFIDCKYCAVRIATPRMIHEERMKLEPKEYQKIIKKHGCKVFFFENMIEGYKFYTYCKALIKNQHEFLNSMKYQIHFNMGKI